MRFLKYCLVAASGACLCLGGMNIFIVIGVEFAIVAILYGLEESRNKD
jgi:hypothetical protein